MNEEDSKELALAYESEISELFKKYTLIGLPPVLLLSIDIRQGLAGLYAMRCTDEDVKLIVDASASSAKYFYEQYLKSKRG